MRGGVDDYGVGTELRPARSVRSGAVGGGRVALVGQVVEDWAGVYFGGPMSLARGDAVRYTVEGHLQDLTAVHGHDMVRAAVEGYLQAYPDALRATVTSEQRTVRAQVRSDRAAVEGRAASAAFTHGRYGDALRHVDAAELADPRGRDYDTIRARIRAASEQASPAGDNVAPGTTFQGRATDVDGLGGRLGETGRSVDQLRVDVDEARRALDAALAGVPPGAAGPPSVAAAALQLLDAVIAAARRHLALAVSEWERIDQRWQALSQACATVLAGGSPGSERLVRTVLPRAAAALAAWATSTRLEDGRAPLADGSVPVQVATRALTDVTSHAQAVTAALSVAATRPAPRSGAVPAGGWVPAPPPGEVAPDFADFTDIWSAFEQLRSAIAGPPGFRVPDVPVAAQRQVGPGSPTDVVRRWSAAVAGVDAIPVEVVDDPAFSRLAHALQRAQDAGHDAQALLSELTAEPHQPLPTAGGADALRHRLLTACPDARSPGTPSLTPTKGLPATSSRSAPPAQPPPATPRPPAAQVRR